MKKYLNALSEGSVVGALAGGVIGYLLRPSVPIIGQLPFRHVITRGKNLSTIQEWLVPTAQSSFNYLLLGLILGAVIGSLLALALSGKHSGMTVGPRVTTTASEIDSTLARLVGGLKSAFGEELESVILYGSAASNEFHPKHSDLNVLVVVKNSRFHKVGRASEIARWWNTTGNPPPLFYTAHEIGESADVFPIEFTDMRDQHRVLFGKDVLAGLNVERTHWRLQCEHEMRGKLLNLRSRYVLVKGDVKECTVLLSRSISSFAVLFRHALHLIGKPAPVKKPDIFNAAAEAFGFDGSVFSEILAVRRGGRKLAKAELDPLFEKYFDAIQIVLDRVDAMAT